MSSPSAEPEVTQGRHATLRAVLCALLVAVLTTIAFQPAFDGQWLHWDDDKNFVEFETWRGLSLEHVKWMFTTFHQGPYQPLSWLTLGIDHALWGMDPRGYHVTNVLIHAAAGAAFFACARALFGQVRPLAQSRPWMIDAAALVAALAFAAHPLRTESVAWVTERRDVLSGLFFALCLWMYLRFTASTGRARTRRLVWALVFYVASLLSKGLGFPLPLALLVLDTLVLGRWNGTLSGAASAAGVSFVALAREKIPFLIPAVLAAVVAWIGQRTHTTVMLTLDSYPFDSRLVQSCYSLFFYAWKTLWPADLIPLVPLPHPLVAGEPRFVIAVVAVLATAALAWIVRRRAPAVGAALLAYAILLAPVSGLTQTGPQLVADRYSYLPCMPLALLFGGALLFAARAQRTWLFAAGLALTLVLVPLSRAQARVWRDDVSLWTKTCAVRPDDAPAFRNLMLAYMRPAEARMDTDPAGAISLFEAGLEVGARCLAAGPDAGTLANLSSIHNSLATIQPEREREHLESALGFARRAVQRSFEEKKHTPAAFKNHAWTAVRLNLPKEAVSSYAWLADAAPDDPGALLSLAQVMVMAERPRDALAVLEVGIPLAPDAPRMWALKGEAHRALDENADAIAAYERAIRCAAALPAEQAENPEEVQNWRALAEALKQK
ncbi:MAG: hypothetical protein JNL28_03220 [Planctomycetes bacterium]|nr:hypothetical protein [Planctomycetota bacterium]